MVSASSSSSSSSLSLSSNSNSNPVPSVSPIVSPPSTIQQQSHQQQQQPSVLPRLQLPSLQIDTSAPFLPILGSFNNSPNPSSAASGISGISNSSPIPLSPSPVTPASANNITGGHSTNFELFSNSTIAGSLADTLTDFGGIKPKPFNYHQQQQQQQFKRTLPPPSPTVGSSAAAGTSRFQHHKLQNGHQHYQHQRSQSSVVHPSSSSSAVTADFILRSIPRSPTAVTPNFHNFITTTNNTNNNNNTNSNSVGVNSVTINPTASSSVAPSVVPGSVSHIVPTQTHSTAVANAMTSLIATTSVTPEKSATFHPGLHHHNHNHNHAASSFSATTASSHSTIPTTATTTTTAVAAAVAATAAAANDLSPPSPASLELSPTCCSTSTLSTETMELAQALPLPIAAHTAAGLPSSTSTSTSVAGAAIANNCVPQDCVGIGSASSANSDCSIITPPVSPDGDGSFVAMDNDNNSSNIHGKHGHQQHIQQSPLPTIVGCEPFVSHSPPSSDSSTVSFESSAQSSPIEPSSPSVSSSASPPPPPPPPLLSPTKESCSTSSMSFGSVIASDSLYSHVFENSTAVTVAVTAMDRDGDVEMTDYYCENDEIVEDQTAGEFYDDGEQKMHQRHLANDYLYRQTIMNSNSNGHGICFADPHQSYQLNQHQQQQQQQQQQHYLHIPVSPTQPHLSQLQSRGSRKVNGFGLASPQQMPHLPLPVSLTSPTTVASSVSSRLLQRQFAGNSTESSDTSRSASTSSSISTSSTSSSSTTASSRSSPYPMARTKQSHSHSHHHQPKLRSALARRAKSYATASASATALGLRFKETVDVYETYDAYEYDRRADPTPRITPDLAFLIKRELNYFKIHEMEIHPESRQNTYLLA
ncbi:hypothetical protein GQ42DRAFT_181850 [Ramicandelaber brevisporus]|nr:hypothetical protein GQ42DRAFT_181850 [Ramicandelaber brevisporus]